MVSICFVNYDLLTVVYYLLFAIYVVIKFVLLAIGNCYY